MRAAAFVAASVAATAFAQQYEAIVLHSAAVPFANSYGAGAGGGQQVGHNNVLLSGSSHAMLWSGTPDSLVDLHPAGFESSFALGAGGGKQVGFREFRTDRLRSYATMWSGSSAGWVDLHPTSFLESRAYDVENGQQVGAGAYADATSATHALLWAGSAASAINLNPATYDYSQAKATDGVHQVGYVGRWSEFGHRAALWSGSADSFVDLTPAGYLQAEATGVSAGHQVGFATNEDVVHALLWTGSASSVTVLNPGSEYAAWALATNGNRQVGAVAIFASGLNRFAAMWSSSAASYVSLHSLLPSEFHGEGAYSVASGIDEAGVIAGWAWDRQRGAYSSVLWRPVPEPSTLFTLALLLLAVRHRFKRVCRNSS